MAQKHLQHFSGTVGLFFQPTQQLDELSNHIEVSRVSLQHHRERWVWVPMSALVVWVVQFEKQTPDGSRCVIHLAYVCLQLQHPTSTPSTQLGTVSYFAMFCLVRWWMNVDNINVYLNHLKLSRCCCGWSALVAILSCSSVAFFSISGPHKPGWGPQSCDGQSISLAKAAPKCPAPPVQKWGCIEHAQV